MRDGTALKDGSLDFRTATGDEALAWYFDQANKMDDALAQCRTEGERLEATLEFLAITSSLVGELLRRVGNEGLRAAA